MGTVNTEIKHIALIPARKGSVGFKYKNRLFFNKTADFIDSLAWLDNVIVSSDDSEIMDKSNQRGYSVHNRSGLLSGGDVSIKAVVENVILEMELSPQVYIWLFYLPILYKDRKDFEGVKSLISDKNINTLCSFIPVETHPYNCWMYSNESKLERFIPNDVYRRQDLPDAWMHYHYLCVFKAGVVNQLNSELIHEDTYPLFLDQHTSNNLIEIDTPADYQKWKGNNDN
jgi:CMP-N-acetylneuraminic acid synthetase